MSGDWRIEVHAVYTVSSAGEVEDIQQRIMATDPDSMDVLDVTDEFPEAA